MRVKPVVRRADPSLVKPEGKFGNGAFQWNRGGWFGSQIGATLWLVLLGFVLLAQSRLIGGLFILLGLVANFAGLWLWRKRESLAPYPAIQILLATCGLCALISMLSLRASEIPQPSVALPSLWFLLMYPGLMLVFHLQEGNARRRAG